MMRELHGFKASANGRRRIASSFTSIVPMLTGHGLRPQAAAQLSGLAAIAGRGGIGWVLDRVYPPSVIVGPALAGLGAFVIAACFGQTVFGRPYGVAFGVFLIGSGTGPVLASASFGSYRPGELPFAACAVLVMLLAFAMPKPPASGIHG